MARSFKNIRSFARAHTEAAVNTLVHIMRQKKTTPSARVQAAVALLDRGWGKPQQHLELTGELTLVDVFAQIAAREGQANEDVKPIDVPPVDRDTVH